MEIKFRRKGEVVIVDGFSSHSIPATIAPNEGFDGIDLTSYSVIYAVFGRHGGEKAKSLHSSAPHAIVVYKYEWRNGFGEGILLPDRFSTDRVHYYKSGAQEGKEAYKAKEKTVEALRDRVIQTISELGISGIYIGYIASYGVTISPHQETHSDDWMLGTQTFEAAMGIIEKMNPLWKEWNARVLKILGQHQISNPGIRSIKLIFSPNSSPDESERVGIRFYQNNAGDLPKKRIIVMGGVGEEWREEQDAVGRDADRVEERLSRR